METNNRRAEAQPDGDEKQPPLSPDPQKQQQQQQQRTGWKKFLDHVGPGFLVSLAYLDPANLETDLQAGSNHKYELLWVILVGLVFALIIQSLAANLGVATGKHLAELCRAEYPKPVVICLWLLAEVAVIASDILEVIGTSFALNILFHIPVWSGVLITGLSTLLILTLQKYGVRKIELLISMMVFLMASCFFVEMTYVKPPATAVLKGLFLPSFSGHNAIGDSIALMGALVMPHNLFLHSALVLSRKTTPTKSGITDACRYFLIESGFALFVSLLINIAVISVSATICNRGDLSPEQSNQCNDLTLNSASFLLRNVLGKSSKTVFAVALLASGLSSAITGTYSGQYVMQGFLDIKMKMWLRNMVTRSISIVPRLIVAVIAGPSGAGKLIVISAMVLSFEHPFALVPLLKFSSSKKMGQHTNSFYIIMFSSILGACLIGINVYYLVTDFVEWLPRNDLPKAISVLVAAAVVFPLMAVYLVGVLYLALRKDAADSAGELLAYDDHHPVALRIRIEAGGGSAAVESLHTGRTLETFLLPS